MPCQKKKNNENKKEEGQQQPFSFTKAQRIDFSKINNQIPSSTTATKAKSVKTPINKPKSKVVTVKSLLQQTQIEKQKKKPIKSINNNNLSNSTPISPIQSPLNEKHMYTYII